MPDRFRFRMMAALVLTASVAGAAPPERTLVLDAVELVEGREVEGLPQHSLFHDGNEYRFSSDANLRAFEKQTARYEVADGGACGRMGPLTGLGDARRHAVHDGRIYFFASDGCREAFLKEPARYIETEQSPPAPAEDEASLGRSTLDKLVAWAGGEARIREVRTFRATAERTVPGDETDWRVRTTLEIEFPDSYRHAQAWNENVYTTVSTPDGGAMSRPDGVDRIAESRRRAFDRRFARHPVVLLRAYVHDSGVIVRGLGASTLDGIGVERVEVWYDGASSVLTVDASSGRLLRQSYFGREGTATVGEVVRSFTEFETVGGLTLPISYEVTFNGNPLERGIDWCDSFEPDCALDASGYAVPAWPGPEEN